MTNLENVDQYIAQSPKEHQSRLTELRALIKNIAPDAEEKIAYGMPGYHWKGTLVYFCLWKKHIGLYGLHSEVLTHCMSDLQGRVAAKGTVQLTLEEPLQRELVQKLLHEQMRLNSKK